MSKVEYKKIVKATKFETKRLGYVLVCIAIVQALALFLYFINIGAIEKCIDITKYTMAIGVALLLGRKFMSELIVRLFGKIVVPKK